MPSWQSTSRIGCLINNPARRSRGATPPARLQWTRVPLDFRLGWRYVVDKAGAANADPALKYKFYFTPHFGGYTEFGIVPLQHCPDSSLSDSCSAGCLSLGASVDTVLFMLVLLALIRMENEVCSVRNFCKINSNTEALAVDLLFD